jgi:coatomer subunit epsilon
MAAASGNESVQEAVVTQLKTMVGGETNPSAQLTVAQVLLLAGQTKEALQCVHLGSTMEHIALALQIYLKIERLDLAKKQLSLLRQADEDSILTQLSAVYVSLAAGSTGAPDAAHALNSLSEQYGASSLLLNLVACALMQQGDYATAEEKLIECLRDFPSETSIPDTLVNLIGCSVQQNKPFKDYVSQLQNQNPTHGLCASIGRVNAAFDRESVKYKL